MIKPLSRRRFMSSVAMSAIGAGASGACVALANVPQRDPPTGKRVTLLHFTDTHAQLETHPEYLPGASPEIQMMGGYARLKTAIDRERALHDHPCFLLDGGDEFQGSGPATWSKGEVVLHPLNALGLDAFVPGNWEAAYGPERFKETMTGLKCPVICYNFHDIASGQPLFAPSAIIEREGVKVAFVGITDISAAEPVRKSAPAEAMQAAPSGTSELGQRGLRSLLQPVTDGHRHGLGDHARGHAGARRRRRDHRPVRRLPGLGDLVRRCERNPRGEHAAVTDLTL